MWYNYVQDEFDASVLIQDLFTFIDENCESEVQTYSKSIAVMVGAMFYDEEIDYNKLFAFIELPDGIESVDYNVLVEKIVNGETYKAFEIGDVHIQHIMKDGEVEKEILTIDFTVDFDMSFLSSITASGKLTLEIEF